MTVVVQEQRKTLAAIVRYACAPNKQVATVSISVAQPGIEDDQAVGSVTVRAAVEQLSRDGIIEGPGRHPDAREEELPSHFHDPTVERRQSQQPGQPRSNKLIRRDMGMLRVPC